MHRTLDLLEESRFEMHTQNFSTAHDMRHHSFTLATVISVCSIAVFYSVLRIFQAIIYIEPDPRILVQTAHIPMFWRLLLSAYLASLVFVGSLALHHRNSAWLYHQLPTLIVITFLTCFIQSILVP